MALLDESLQGKLLFAIPKKGRLYEKCLELLAGADLQFTRSNRLDFALVRTMPNMALVFLPAADIPRFVGEGNCDLGITGQDMVAEAGLDDLIVEQLKLGFGKCKLQVQAPVKSGINEVSQLVGKKVVTSFENIAGSYFAKLDQERGQGCKTTLEYVGGSVEAACALGLADGIVDLVESGETMRAAGLQAIGTILSSEAVLLRSVQPKKPEHLPVIDKITRRIEGVLAANKFLLCTYNIRRSLIKQACEVTPGRRAPTVTSLEEEDWVAVQSMVLKSEAAAIMDRLQEIGAVDIFLLSLHNCRV